MTPEVSVDARMAPTVGGSPEALRAALVEALRSRGRLRSPALAEAFSRVPRHLFVPDASVEEAYRDTFIATKRQPDGEVISSSSQPEIMAIMLEQLDLRSGQRVLEIGAGTGYNAALLAHVVGDGGRVTALDIDDDIVVGARAHLAAAGVAGVRVVQADGWAGLAEDAPFDRIILTVGAHDISPAWRAQLAPGGRLVLPLSLPAVQASVAFAERDAILESVSVWPCQFMRLRGSAAVALRPVPVGPEPAPGVWPRAGHTVDGAAVHAFLRTPGEWLSTGLVGEARELYAGLIAWVGLREPTSGWFVAQGAAMAAGLVPSFVGDGKEARATYGLFEPGGVALFVREPTPPEGADGGFSIGIRVHGDTTLGERLLTATLTWNEAGRPDVQRLRIRAYPSASAHEPQPQEIVLTRPCTRLVVDWSPVPPSPS
jgi:protein-L-isoaspartate(D-aspartate) O-methyltransferase